MKQSPFSQFFNNPSMWFWALVMVAVMSVAVTHISGIYASADGLQISLSELASPDDSILDKYVGNHLAPFKIQIHSTGDLSFFTPSNIIIYSDFISGILIMALCIIGVVIVTKRSSDSISVLGPFWVYSVASLLYGSYSMNSVLGVGVRAHIVWFPCLTSLVVTSIIVALACRTIIRHAVNQGWISGIDTNSDEPVQVNPVILSQVNQFAGQVNKVAGNILESGSASTSRKIVGRNIRCCPFCGSDNFTAVKPHPYGSQCNSCGRIVGALEELVGESNQCPVCPSGLVNGAKFCHRCGSLLANHQMDPISNGSNHVYDNNHADLPGNDKYEQHDRNHLSENRVSTRN
jgi:hypothetical protein